MLPKKWDAKRERTGGKKVWSFLLRGLRSTKATCSSFPQQTFPDLSRAFPLFAVGVPFRQVTHGEGKMPLQDGQHHFSCYKSRWTFLVSDLEELACWITQYLYMPGLIQTCLKLAFNLTQDPMFPKMKLSMQTRPHWAVLINTRRKTQRILFDHCLKTFCAYL